MSGRATQLDGNGAELPNSRPKEWLSPPLRKDRNGPKGVQESIGGIPPDTIADPTRPTLEDARLERISLDNP